MAEGGNISQKMDSGSEALFEHECVQCRADGSKQEASHRCQDCEQLLCQTCGKYHIRYMRNHTLANVSSDEPSNLKIPTVGQAPVGVKCLYHPERDIELYCGNHDMVYCCLCIAKDHRSCSDVKEIGDVNHNSQFSTLQSFLVHLARVIKHLNETKLGKANDLKCIKKMKSELLHEINTVRTRLNKHLDTLERRIVAELDAEQNKLEKEINADIKVANDLVFACNQRKTDLAAYCSKKHMFIMEKITKPILVGADSFLEKARLSKYPIMKFEVNSALCEAIMKSYTIGNIITCDTKSKHKQRSDYAKCTANYIDTPNRRCIDMCLLSNGTILLIGKNCLSRLDEEYNLKDSYQLKTNPLGICAVSPTEVAVRLDDKTIQFISVNQFLSYQRRVTIDLTDQAGVGMACCNNQLWVPGKEAIFIFSLTGSLVKKIETDFNGREIFPNTPPHQIAVSDDETKVFVAAWDDRVIVFNNDGEVMNEIRNERLKNTRNVCIMEDDILLVQGKSSNIIFLFDTDSNCLGEFVVKNRSGYNVDFTSNLLIYDKIKRLLFCVSDNVRVLQLI